MYHGEVQILHEDIDEFLTQAQKLQIDGIIFDNDTRSDILKPPPQPKIISNIKRETLEETIEPEPRNVISEVEVADQGNLILEEVEEMPETRNLVQEEVEEISEQGNLISKEMEDILENRHRTPVEEEDITDAGTIIPEGGKSSKQVQDEAEKLVNATDSLDHSDKNLKSTADTNCYGSWGNLWKKFKPNNVPQVLEEVMSPENELNHEEPSSMEQEEEEHVEAIENIHLGNVLETATEFNKDTEEMISGLLEPDSTEPASDESRPEKIKVSKKETKIPRKKSTKCH